MSKIEDIRSPVQGASYLIKLNTDLPCPTKSSWGIYPREMKAYFHTKTFTAALFIIKKKKPENKSNAHQLVNG